MANHYLAYSFFLPLDDEEQVAWLCSQATLDAARCEVAVAYGLDEDEGFDLDDIPVPELDVWQTPNGWRAWFGTLYGEGYDLDLAVCLVQFYLARYHPDRSVIVNVVALASKPLVGEIFGWTVLVTAEDAQIIDPDQIARQSAANQGLAVHPTF